MNKLPLANLPISNAGTGTYERTLSAKLNELFRQLIKASNDLINGFNHTPTLITTTYSATTGDNVILCANGTYTVTLPSASEANGKLMVVKKKAAAGTITVATVSGNIDTSATYSLSSAYAKLVVVSDGVDYWSL